MLYLLSTDDYSWRLSTVLCKDNECLEDYPTSVVADMKVDMVPASTINININIEIQFGHGGWLIGLKLFLPDLRVF